MWLPLLVAVLLAFFCTVASAESAEIESRLSVIERDISDLLGMVYTNDADISALQDKVSEIEAALENEVSSGLTSDDLSSPINPNLSLLRKEKHWPNRDVLRLI